MGYPRQVYERARGILSARRDEIRERASARRSEIHGVIPEIAAIERRMASAAAGITKALLISPEKAGDMIEELGKKNLALQQQREVLLINAGYPADYLSEKPFCEKCGDSGYIGTDMCSCLSALLREQAHAYLNALAPSGTGSFGEFDLRLYPDSPDNAGVNARKWMGEVYNFCVSYAASFTGNSESLLFLGQTGLGKTHLSVAIARAVTEKGYGVLYIPVQKLMDRLETDKFSRVSGGREQFMESLDIVLGCDLLILDDLGTEFSTSFTASALYNIVNSRIVDRHPTIISTNLDPQEIEQRYSHRMVSRLLCEYRTFKFIGRDIRFVKKKNTGNI